MYSPPSPSSIAVCLVESTVELMCSGGPRIGLTRPSEGGGSVCVTPVALSARRRTNDRDARKRVRKF